VHGVGAGSDADRVGFSLKLAQGVDTRRRRVTRVGRLPDRSIPRDAPTDGIHWEEALWESEHDTADRVAKAALGGLGATPGMLGDLVGYFLDVLLDVPFYLAATGEGIRRRVRSVIAAHPGCIVVGHSLGSVIAADVLARSFSPSGVPLDVAGLVTIGSPLNLLGLRLAMREEFPFVWSNYRYGADPICFSGNLNTDEFPGVRNFSLSSNEGFGVAHTHYWSSQVVANSIRRMSSR